MMHDDRAHPAERPYRPIACSLHDGLEAAATRRKPVAVSYRTADGSVVDTNERVLDIITRNGVEFVRLEQSDDVRLDDLLTVDGIPFVDAPTGSADVSGRDESSAAGQGD